MPVTINGNGSITGLSVGGLGSGVVNAASLAANSVTASAMPVGSILQVKNFIKKDRDDFSTSSSFAATGMSVTITPSSTSNKLLVMANLEVGNSGNNSVQFKLYRGTSEITAANNTNVTNKSFGWSYIRQQNNTEASYQDVSVSLGYEHTPADTNSHEFNLYVNSFNTTVYLNGRGYSGDYGGTSSLTVMEIKG